MPMFGFNFPRQGARRAILAEAVNRPADQVARLSRATVGGGLASLNAAGSDLPYSVAGRPFIGRITAVGTSTRAGSYAWQAIVADPAHPGAYLDVPGWSGALGVDAAYEYNLTTSLSVGDRVDLVREHVSQEVRFQFDHC